MSADIAFEAASAFLGAFFGLIFAQIANFLQLLSQRKRREWEMLKKIELLSIHGIDAISQNITLLDSIEKEKPAHASLRLHHVPMYSDAIELTQLSNIDVINEIISLDAEIRRLNSLGKDLGERLKSEDAVVENFWNDFADIKSLHVSLKRTFIHVTALTRLLLTEEMPLLLKLFPTKRVGQKVERLIPKAEEQINREIANLN